MSKNDEQITHVFNPALVEQFSKLCQDKKRRKSDMSKDEKALRNAKELIEKLISDKEKLVEYFEFHFDTIGYLYNARKDKKRIPAKYDKILDNWVNKGDFDIDAYIDMSIYIGTFDKQNPEPDENAKTYSCAEMKEKLAKRIAQDEKEEMEEFTTDKFTKFLAKAKKENKATGWGK